MPEHSPIFWQPATIIALDYLHVMQVGFVPGQGSPPSATAGTAVDNVVASNRVTAKIRRMFFTVRLLLEVVVRRQFERLAGGDVKNLPGVQCLETGTGVNCSFQVF